MSTIKITSETYERFYFHWQGPKEKQKGSHFSYYREVSVIRETEKKKSKPLSFMHLGQQPSAVPMRKQSTAQLYFDAEGKKEKELFGNAGGTVKSE